MHVRPKRCSAVSRVETIAIVASAVLCLALGAVGIAHLREEGRSKLCASLDIEYPPDTRTGIPEIDRVIDAYFSANIHERSSPFILPPSTR